jgi:mannitol/fructose-specific phosphotransferase system IIA component (Ntr-type)
MPLLIVGRSAEGVAFSPQSAPVQLLFLLVTPAEQPDDQLSLLAQLARLVGDETAREELLRAASAGQIIDLLCDNIPRGKD